MSRTRLMYIELKTGYNDNGPAWIGQVKFSQSGRTVYFNGHALKRSGGGGGSNHYDLETSDGYWVSGIKKDGTDRHWAGSGKIMIEARVVDEYLKLTGEDKLDTSRFEVTTNIADTDIQRFHEKENKSL